MPTRRFPATPDNFAPVMTAYYHAMEQLARTLMRVFAVALELPSADYFEYFLEQHWSALRTLHYPAMQSDATEKEDVLHIRAGEHTDYGALTILRTDGPGLQVQTKSSQAGGECQWMDVPVLADSNVLIINIGDMMQRWTNDEWVSTLHRVVAIPDEASSDYFSRRQSMAYFCNIHGHALVSPLSSCCRNHPAKYGPILAKDHLMAKHLASMGYKW